MNALENTKLAKAWSALIPCDLLYKISVSAFWRIRLKSNAGTDAKYEAKRKGT